MMNAAQVQNVVALPRLVIDNTPESFSSTNQLANIVDLLREPQMLDDFERRVDFACAAHPIFKNMIDAFEAGANDYKNPIDPDGETVEYVERSEELLKRIRSVVSSLITEYLSRDEQNDVDQRALNQLLRFEKTFHPFIANLQRYRWIIMSIDGGLAPTTGRTFDNADEFVEAQLAED